MHIRRSIRLMCVYTSVACILIQSTIIFVLQNIARRLLFPWSFESCKEYSCGSASSFIQAMPKQVLKDQYESESEGDETENLDGGNELTEDELNYKETEAIPKVYSNSNVIYDSTTSATGSVNSNISINLDIPESASTNPLMTHNDDLEDNQERLYLYLLIGGLVGVTVCILIVTGHAVIQKHQTHSAETQMTSINGSCNAGLNTTMPNGFNDTISEIEAEIDIQTHIPVSSVSKKENYVTYGPESVLYSGIQSSNNIQISSTFALHGDKTMQPNTGVSETSSSTLKTNFGLCGSGQSPDIMGISSKARLPEAISNAMDYRTDVRATLKPAIVIGDTECRAKASIKSGTDVPMTSLTQFTSAPIIRAGYLMNAEGMLKRAPNLHITPTASSAANNHYSASSIIGYVKPSAIPSVLHHQLSYDGTAPRTLSTGVPVNSQFYYG